MAKVINVSDDDFSFTGRGTLYPIEWLDGQVRELELGLDIKKKSTVVAIASLQQWAKGKGFKLKTSVKGNVIRIKAEKLTNRACTRRESYLQGYEDAKDGKDVDSNHPLIESYSDGYTDFQLDAHDAKPEDGTGDQ